MDSFSNTSPPPRKKTLIAHALWLNSLGYLAQADESRDGVVVLTEDGPQFVTRELLDDRPVAEALPSLMPPPSPEKLAEVRAANAAELRRALEQSAGHFFDAEDPTDA